MNDIPRKPTDSELDILRVLWTHGPATVRQVQEHLPPEPKRGYTTVLKLMQIMTDKGLVSRDESSRAHIYHPTASAEQTQQSLLGHLIDKAYSGSAGRLIMQALSTRPASADDLAELRRFLDRMEDSRS
ncbi:MAG: BlaI/MecI/CopY family transcriptional regulator [candidate division Zixibacteria bacterium]|nr:BlaI/MecI/CopY family transcriptional regulator [candidate division Zixibacteria bacterium]